ncbi:MAG: hypothetical protein D6771_04075, partial [Zetaproteobacteria bacterium]
MTAQDRILAIAAEGGVRDAAARLVAISPYFVQLCRMLDDEALRQLLRPRPGLADPAWVAPLAGADKPAALRALRQAAARARAHA